MDRLRMLVLVVLFGSGPPTAFAEPPRVYFDMPYAAACRDVTPCEFTTAHPGQKLIEARLEISSLLTTGKERDLSEYFIRVENPERKLAIVDYLPKTLHESRLAGPITVQDGKEKTGTLGINFSGKYEVISGVGPSAGVGQKNSSSVKYDLLPPLETVAASGTLARGSAVFFKLKASPRHLLEGSREYGLVLQVPGSWRADYIHVRCEAEGIQRGMVSSLDETLRCGERDFLVALYLEGDEQARLAADNFARREAARIQRPTKSKAQSSSKDVSTWMLGMPGTEMLRR
jgi:hypothetical protein